MSTDLKKSGFGKNAFKISHIVQMPHKNLYILIKYDQICPINLIAIGVVVSSQKIHKLIFRFERSKVQNLPLKSHRP